MSKREEFNDLFDLVSSSVHHGECFYRKEYLDEFVECLDNLKRLSLEYYQENKDEDEDEE